MARNGIPVVDGDGHVMEDWDQLAAIHVPRMIHGVPALNGAKRLNDMWGN